MHAQDQTSPRDSCEAKSNNGCRSMKNPRDRIPLWRGNSGVFQAEVVVLNHPAGLASNPKGNQAGISDSNLKAIGQPTSSRAWVKVLNIAASRQLKYWDCTYPVILPIRSDPSGPALAHASTLRHM
jgi:hypothetical protein